MNEISSELHPAEKFEAARLPNAGPTISTARSIALVCRDNGLYGKLVTMLDTVLTQHGCNVRSRIFEAHTPEATIGDELSRFNFADRQVIISDLTSYRFGRIRDTKIQHVSIDDAYSAESVLALQRGLGLFEWGKGDLSLPISERWVTPQTMIRPEYIAECGQAITHLFSLVFERHRPERIDLFTGRILEHLPWFAYSAWFERYQREHVSDDPSISAELFMREMQDSIIAPHVLTGLRQAYGVELPQPHDAIASWIIAAGFPSDRLRIVRDFSELHPDQYRGRDILIVGDRHLLKEQYFMERLASKYQSGQIFDCARAAADLIFRLPMMRFPIDSLLQDVLERDLIRTSDYLDRSRIVGSVAGNILERAQVFIGT